MAYLLDANVFIAANNLHYQVHDTLRDVAPRTRTVCPLGSLMSDQTNERAFETHVEETLLGASGWQRCANAEWDVERALFPVQVRNFLKEGMLFSDPMDILPQSSGGLAYPMVYLSWPKAYAHFGSASSISDDSISGLLESSSAPERICVLPVTARLPLDRLPRLPAQATATS